MEYQKLVEEISALRDEIQKLKDVAEIERLKFNYWDSMDRKDWKRFAEVFTEDFHWDSSSCNGVVSDGRDAIVAGISAYMPEHFRSCHQGHQHWIEITGPDTAKGAWVLRDNLYNCKTNAQFWGRGFYEDEYKKIDGKWYISKTVLTYFNCESSYMKKFSGDSDLRDCFGLV